MAPNQDEGLKSPGHKPIPICSPAERVPLIGGASIAATSQVFAPSPRNNFSSVYSGDKFPGGGHSIRKSVEQAATPRGLLTDADDLVAEETCCSGVETTLYSILTRLPALHTFSVLGFFIYFGHMWLLQSRPDIAVTIIGIFILYGVVRFWGMWFSALRGLRLLQKNDSRHPQYWQRKPRPLGSVDFKSVWHAVIVPAYKEPIAKLRQTLDTLASQSIAPQIVVCMGMESRDPNSMETAAQLEKEYAERLGGFCYTSHALAQGEVAGKSSNENWAARCVKRLMVDRMRINPDNIVLTTCDADTFFHPNHFACLTHHFICDGDNRHHRFYLGVANFMPNVMHVPAICSARYTVLSVGRMAEMGSPVSDPFPLAIYSISLRLAMKAAYWDPSVIPEDWHMYFRCVFADQGRVKCTRMYIAVGTEAVEGKDAVDTVKEVYNQSVRWQWGATDVGYLLVQSLARWDVPLRQRLSLLFTAYDHHLLVIVIAVVLATAPLLYGNIPVAVGILKLTNTAISLKDVMITTWAVHFLLHFPMLCYADHAMRRTVLYDRLYFDCNEGAWSSGPRRWLCLLLFPLADIFLFLIPTLHAHAKMFISSSFNYVPSAKMGARGCPGACLPSRSDEEEYEVIPDLRV